MELKELLQRDDLYFRGYDSRYGVFDSEEKYSFTWATEDPEYALEYAKDKPYGRIAIVELETDEIGGVFSLSEDTDYYDPSEKAMKSLYKNGYWGYGFYCNSDNSYCICVNKNFLKINCIVDCSIFIECLKELDYV